MEINGNINKYDIVIKYMERRTIFFRKDIKDCKFKKQQQLKHSIINDIFYICNTSNDCKFCSEKFKLFFIENNYHIEQNLDLMIKIIKK